MRTKHAIITGAGGGLGTAVLEKYLSMGYYVSATVEYGRSLESRPGLDVYELDVTDERACMEFVQEVAGARGGVDTALLLVGGFAMGDIESTHTMNLEKMYQLNFLSAYHIARPVFGFMSRQQEGGRIVMVGARPALKHADAKKMIAYSLSKGQVMQFDDILNAAGKEHDVHCAVVVPGTIDTPGNRASMPDADWSRWASPADIAEVMAFATDGAGRILRETVLKVYNQS
ncbi:MAG: SDR family NAD(P)-dependent oxidoreductase [Bacteroidetes bacterium]|nr:SDR family NAD(P)-dependent oxidoreductase [Bacteroidota bacterium]